MIISYADAGEQKSSLAKMTNGAEPGERTIPILEVMTILDRGPGEGA
jgi:hypothetical protein